VVLSPRPLLRAIARLIDVTLLMLTGCTVLGMCGVGSMSWWVSAGIVWGGLVLWLPLEALLLATWGTTPGKALAALSVRDAYGRKLTLGDALRRAFTVWLWGLAAGIWPLTIVAAAVSYRRLRHTGSTRWDDGRHSHVAQGEIGPGQLVLLILVICAVMALLLGAALAMASVPARLWPR